MADRRSDAPATARLLRRTTRRAAANALAALGLLPALAAMPDVATARKGRSKKSKKGKKGCKQRAKDDARATCPDVCPDTCAVCAERLDGEPLCADGLATIVNPGNACDSDNDCVGRSDSPGNPLPYCTVIENIGGFCSRVTAPCS